MIKLSRSNDIITRKGGEEFTVMLPNCDIQPSVIVDERIRSFIQNYNFTNENNQIIKITVSIGVSSYPETTANVEKLIEQADIALYVAKRSGRNMVIVAEQ